MTDNDPNEPASPELHIPQLPPDWWRCARSTPLSGRYDGLRSTPTTGGKVELRIDVDRRYRESPVLDVVSFDLFDHHTFNWFGRIWEWDVYRSSWIAEGVEVTWNRCDATIEGAARHHETGEIRALSITIAWAMGRLTSTSAVIGGETYTCTRRGHGFRTLDLEVDVCESVNIEPIEPGYDVTWHPDRPADTPNRFLTIEESFAEAGVELQVNAPAERTIIDDSSDEFDTWSDEELHDAMESFYSRWAGAWPAWRMWFLVAGSYDNAGTGGIMFDYRGPAEPPERQGCAIFRNHRWWNELVDGVPETDAQAVAHRKWLHTWVHEVGHGLNFVHSWNKNRPDSPSWMNYDWRYDNRNGRDSYFRDFRFAFDLDELLHLRHGKRSEVIPGGDAWATGRHADAPESIGELSGMAPVELIVRSKGTFDFLEPVKLEVRVRNLADLDIEIDGRLAPDFGTVGFQIRRPDGRIIDHHTPMCRLGDPESHVLVDPTTGEKGEDRLSAEVLVGYGADGIVFDEPGTYIVRAEYHGPGGLTVPSAPHRFRVTTPRTRREEELAGDLLSRDAGLALYLGGSASPHLATAMGHLQQAAAELASSAAGAQIAACIAPTFTRDRFRLTEEQTLVRSRAADPKAAIELMDQALAADKKRGQALTPITQHELNRARAMTMAEVGKKTEAKKALRSLKRSLAAQGVNKPVLDDLEAFITAL